MQLGQEGRVSLAVLGWPSDLGGADTKLAHLLELLAGKFEITVIPNWEQQLGDVRWRRRLDRLGIKTAGFGEWTGRSRHPGGVVFGLCNEYLFQRDVDGVSRWERAHELEAFMVYSSEMPWHQAGELEHVRSGLMDRILLVSETQRARLTYPETIETVVTGNYVNPEVFPFVDRRERWRSETVFGRLSRAHVEKYPEDFPVIYELLADEQTKFRVMAWSSELAQKYRWHRFSSRWELLPPLNEPSAKFLHSVDIFLYSVGYKFTETWGRSMVEAMLTGAVPVVAAGHHLQNNFEHGVSGFVASSFDEFADAVDQLRDLKRRWKMSRAAMSYANEVVCDRAAHRKIWVDALTP